MNVPKAILATVVYIIVIELSGSWIHIPSLTKTENYLDYYNIIQGTLQLFIILIFLFGIKRYCFKNLIKKTNYIWYLLAFIMGSIFVFIQTPLKWFYNYLFDTTYYIDYSFDGISKFHDINLISIILIIPIGEELFFRGYIQKRLQLKTTTSICILVTSILFALIHAPYSNLLLEEYYQDWHLFYLTFFGGLLSGILYYKSKSIGPSIIFHIFWNLMVSIF
ncbi:type II CAAX endopeptidase family protein [uncultured Dokdonia sp.]|uniref:CPBP family intramembrane glutamic endopeptidase n=1 Tax=uncultured Dokdonia sp. TaxID=575653 RepID=UPI00263736B5|nr:type II CAAX endopeptidase family protein [uncultured Dokdonia sp.]